MHKNITKIFGVVFVLTIPFTSVFTKESITTSIANSKYTKYAYFNVRLSNPVKGNSAALVIHLPVKVKTPCCFRIYITLPEKIDIGIIEDFRNNQNIIRSSTYFNGIPLIDFEYSNVIAFGKNEIKLEMFVPNDAEQDCIRIYFSELLKITFVEEGEYKTESYVNLPKLSISNFHSSKFRIFEKLP